MSGYRKLLIERARAKELKQRTLIYEKQQAVIAAAAVAAKIEGKARRRKQKAFRKYLILIFYQPHHHIYHCMVLDTQIHQHHSYDKNHHQL